MFVFKTIIHLNLCLIFNVRFVLVAFTMLGLTACLNAKKENEKDNNTTQTQTDLKPVIAMPNGDFKARFTKESMNINGEANEAIWTRSTWYDLNYNWLGNPVDSLDYYGRFKLAWDSEHLYVLVEVVDEYLNPTLKNGIENYWKGDYVEVFIDEDASGGNHLYNHQAFAYHVSTEGHAIDLNTSKQPMFFDNHVRVKRSQNGNIHLWEMAITLFDDQFNENAKTHTPVKITDQKHIGFSMAYGDNDGLNQRENFMGSKKNHGKNNDEGYVNSDVFGRVLCVK